MTESGEETEGLAAAVRPQREPQGGVLGPGGGDVLELEGMLAGETHVDEGVDVNGSCGVVGGRSRGGALFAP